MHICGDVEHYVLSFGELINKRNGFGFFMTKCCLFS